jgi:hypothetical protein
MRSLIPATIAAIPLAVRRLVACGYHATTGVTVSAPAL